MSDPSSARIDLAPKNPYGLELQSPVLIAPGCDLRAFRTDALGAVTTRTATLHTRRGTSPRFAATPAGLVVSDLPTAGIRTLLKEERQRWERSSLPMIVSIQGDVGECAAMAAMLENVEGVAGLLITAEADPAVVVAATRRATPRPILALLPLSDGIAAAAGKVVGAGADTLVVVGPPRATGVAGEPVEGFWLGPTVLPLTLQALVDLRETVEVPIIALGGIATTRCAKVALEAGATAVMVDAARWGDPEAPARIARELREERV